MVVSILRPDLGLHCEGFRQSKPRARAETSGIRGFASRGVLVGDGTEMLAVRARPGRFAPRSLPEMNSSCRGLSCTGTLSLLPSPTGESPASVQPSTLFRARLSADAQRLGGVQRSLPGQPADPPIQVGRRELSLLFSPTPAHPPS